MTTRQSRRNLKLKVLAFLQSDNLDEALNELCRLPARQAINPLFSFLLSSEEQTKWRAVTAMGAVVANLAEQDMESARVIMRRLMWSLNDESGGIGWGAPEAMGEIIASHDRLAKEYVSVLISYVWKEGNFLEYEPLQRGAMWGVGRVAQVIPELVQDAGLHLLPYLESTDSAVRGLAAWAVGLLGVEEARQRLEVLIRDDIEISMFLDRKLIRCSVNDLVKEALARIDNRRTSNN